jgi:hypothetical protein
MELILVLLAVPLLVAVPVFRRVRSWCRAESARRPWLIGGAIAALALVAFLVPGVGALEPPYSESPSGLFVIFARVEVLGVVSCAALATLLAATVRWEPPGGSVAD